MKAYVLKVECDALNEVKVYSLVIYHVLMSTLFIDAKGM